jgi:YegS/Rv2252/BmrU family lipid kinase
MMKKKIRFIINPKSGARNKKHFSDWILQHTDRDLFEPEICFTEAPGHAAILSREAAENNYVMVVAVGGDGSVNETAQGLYGTGTSLGIIPTGSGNGLARHLRIPMDFVKAVQSLNHSIPFSMDSLRINDKLCLGTFGIGFDAHIAHLFAGAAKRGYSTYVKLVLKEFYKYPTYQYNMVVDGKSVVKEAFLLTFANSSQFGNNAVIAPFANVTDGKIDLVMVKKFPAIKAPQLIYRMMNNILFRSRYFESQHVTHAVVINSNSLKGHIDGEPVSFSGNIEIRMVPGSVNILRPSEF